MKANPSRTRIGRSQHLQSIELIHGVSGSYSLPRHFHDELELGIRQGDGWQFNYRGAMHNVPPDTLVVTQPGEAHYAHAASDRDCTFRGLRVDIALLQILISLCPLCLCGSFIWIIYFLEVPRKGITKKQKLNEATVLA